MEPMQTGQEEVREENSKRDERAVWLETEAGCPDIIQC